LTDLPTSGKSTLAEHLAAHLNYLFFDTGIMYRAVTFAALEDPEILISMMNTQ